MCLLPLSGTCSQNTMYRRARKDPTVLFLFLYNLPCYLKVGILDSVGVGLFTVLQEVGSDTKEAMGNQEGPSFPQLGQTQPSLEQTMPAPRPQVSGCLNPKFRNKSVDGHEESQSLLSVNASPVHISSAASPGHMGWLHPTPQPGVESGHSATATSFRFSPTQENLDQFNAAE